MVKELEFALKQLRTAVDLQTFAALPDEAVVRRPLVRAILGQMSDAGIERALRVGRLPKPTVKLNKRDRGWRAGEIRNVLAELERAGAA